VRGRSLAGVAAKLRGLHLLTFEWARNCVRKIDDFIGEEISLGLARVRVLFLKSAIV